MPSSSAARGTAFWLDHAHPDKPIKLDGVKVAVPEDGELPLPVGRHHIEITTISGDTISDTVDVKAGKRVPAPGGS